MDVYTFTTDPTFNFFMSFFVNVSLGVIASFGAIALLRN